MAEARRAEDEDRRRRDRSRESLRSSARSAPSELIAAGELAGRILADLDVWLNVHDAQFNMLVWNRAAERLSGYRSEEVLGHSGVWDLCYPDLDYRDSIVEKARAIVEEGETVGGFQNEIVCRDGGRRCMSWNSSPFVDEAGQVQGAVVVGYDVTELQRSRDRLRRLNEELSLLYDVASVASESLELDTILEQCLARVLRTLPADAGLIHLREQDSPDLALAAHYGVPRETLDSAREAKRGEGLIGGIYSAGEPLTIGDVRRDERASPVARRSGMRSFAGVPMRAKGRVLGVFSVLGRQPNRLRAKDMALLSSVGDQIGLTIDHARLQRQAAVLEERSRLARELHDSVSQSLYSLTLFAEAGRRHLAQGDLQPAQERLERLVETSQETFREMRLLVHELRPPDLEAGGLRGALERRLETVERRTGVEVDLDVDAALSLPLKLEEALYRIAQEALNNALRHARARKVAVCASVGEQQVRLEVRDDGVGFDPSRSGRHGLGLLSIRERVDRIRGTLRVDSKPGRGTTVAVVVELPGEAGA